MALAFDEFGRPFIIVKEQEQKTRLRGLDAQKANIASGKAVARILRCPKGRDKMLQSPDGDVTITWRDAFSTDVSIPKDILTQYEAEALLHRGIHPRRIAKGYEMARIAVKHLKKIAHAEGKVGGKLEDTELIYGIVVNKDMSHPQMPKQVNDAKFAILTCPFKPPKPKTKPKDVGATLVIYQWGFVDVANHLFMHRNLPAVRWLGGAELELIAIATDFRQLLTNIQELSRYQMLLFLSFHCELLNLVLKLLSCDLQHAIRGFADALDSIPLALAENGGLQPIETLSAVKSQQLKENYHCCGIDCNDFGTNNMREQNVFETLIRKQLQILLATQVVRMILKIDDVVVPSDYSELCCEFSSSLSLSLSL
ncbi:hypothetical protein Nepgr_003377 [Nepenthes gracilis]|uniref:Uncharacterized protein n=1 Tax=Nepenthes gracilis TaxID=150966 RepID=A0AAD3RZD8_NEPGR|nr:hypothetical protein Nepgr_003377 [Nepenthes gracilis]